MRYIYCCCRELGMGEVLAFHAYYCTYLIDFFHSVLLLPNVTAAFLSYILKSALSSLLKKYEGVMIIRKQLKIHSMEIVCIFIGGRSNLNFRLQWHIMA